MGIRVDGPFAHRSQLGEGPHWDGDRLLYVDIQRGEVHRLDVHTGEQDTVTLQGPVGFAVPSREGRLIVGRQSTVEEIDWSGRTVRVLATVEKGLSETRINDGKCDPRGRVFYGTISAERRPVGGFYRTSASGSTVRVLDGVTVSNGLGWDDRRHRLYYVDSWTWRVDVLDYDEDTGETTNRRPFVSIDRADGLPDGLTVDAEGGVWVCLFSGGAVHRYSPEGNLTEVLSLPVSLPTSVAFGGTGLRTLFVTSARHRLSAAEAAEQPLAGGVLMAEVGVAGCRAVGFAG
ncbi:SMP-30/gluconolactonase/LRE family protein [Saccharomonospora sp. NPDC046836]|uniref:SMP-30/gluconolactonase/LRE family protein n=1 Tax=Saccharomonospora sp. NPDC046836 TaxID=3156921 RepID=UPI0033F04A65